uniref:Protein EMBRYONIC FLOWER 1 n=1 Tax=Ananas comosus var. bracteatus TaxID=296719 RepID=A0A6V7PT71_ANACO|nr:unnamed protein product [Ananas comosus var. bracteatus]
MAMAFEGFSIRVRGEDEERGREQMLALRRGRGREGAAADAGEEVPVVVRRARRLGIGARGAAPEVEEEGRAQGRPSSARAKQRAPKKRSIVELFAVAPQIEAVGDETDGSDGEGRGCEGEEEEEEEEEGGGGEANERGGGGGGGGGSCGGGEGHGCDERVSEVVRKRKERRKGDGKGEKMMRKKSWMKIRNRKNKKKQRLQIKICIAKKEKMRKPKLSPPLDISHLLQDTLYKKLFKKSISSSIHTQKKKPQLLKDLFQKQNIRKIQNTKSAIKNQKAEPKDVPVHSILKKKKRSSSVKKADLIDNMEDGYSKKPCLEVKKHVTFSGKDDIFGNSKSPSSNELSHLESPGKISSDVSAASKTRDEATDQGDKLPSTTEKAQMANETGIDVASEVVVREVSSIPEKTQPNDAYSHKNNCLDKRKTFLGESVDLNHAVQSSSTLNCLNFGTSTSSSSRLYSDEVPALNSYTKEGSKSGAGIHAQECFHLTLDGRQLMPLPISSRSETSSWVITSNVISQPSATGKERGSFGTAKMNTCAHIMSSISSSTGSNKSLDTILSTERMSSCRSFCFNDDYVGLPLNSQGELIRMNSKGHFDHSELFKQQDTRKGSSGTFSVPNLVKCKNILDRTSARRKKSGEPLYNTEHFRWYPEFQYSPGAPVTSGVGFVQLPDFRRMGVKSKGQFGQYPMDVSCNGCMERVCQAQNLSSGQKFQIDGYLGQEIQHSAQPTMRLMGKTVAVGKSSEECRDLDDGRIWTDKEIIAEECHPGRMNNKEFPYLMTQKEVPSSMYRAPAVELRFDHVHFDNQPQRISRSHVSSSFGNPTRLNNYSQSTHQSMLNNSMTSLNSVTRYEELGHRAPFLETYPQDVNQSVLLNSTHCKHSQSLLFSTSSTSDPYKKYKSFVETSSAQSSSCFPQWLINSDLQKRSQKSSFLSFSDPPNVHHPYSVTTTNLPCLSSGYPPSVVSFPAYDTYNHRPSGFSPLVYPSYIQSYPAARPNYSVSSANRSKLKSRNEMKSKFTLNDLDNTNRSNKRPAAEDDELFRPAKKPHLTLQEDLNGPVGLREKEQLNSHTPNGTGTEEKFDSHTKNGEICPQSLNDGKNETGNAGVSSLDCVRRSGPLKLSAGAKHVLKPSQNTDLDNSRPIHSTIPFPVGTSCNTVPVPQNKATKIYRF